MNPQTGMNISILGRSAKDPQNRSESVGPQACEAVGGKYIGGWYCFGEYDILLIADVPDNESMTGHLAGGSARGCHQSQQDDPIDDGAQAVNAMKKATDVSKVYRPAT